MKKGQGLPLNFIVLAAMAILILVLVVAFVLMGKGSITQSMTPQQITTSCQSYCQSLNNWAAGKNYPDAPASSIGSNAPQQFCTARFATSANATMSCPGAGSACIVSFGDGSSCRVACGDTTPFPVLCATT